MKKTVAIKKANGVRALAAIFGITTQAVRNWPVDLPELRVYQLKELRPAWFEKVKK